MRVVIFGHNPKNAYSGGRYHAWMMAEALAMAGNEVWYVTDNRPLFMDDFIDFPAHDRVNLFIARNWDNFPDGRFDVIFVVPTLFQRLDFYLKALAFARSRGARVILMNFETPNWFNEYSPHKVNPRLWKGWRYVSKSATMVLSSSREGCRYAKNFYTSCNKNTLFDYCYPSVNSIVADRVGCIRKEKKIIMITRFGRNSFHKGGYLLENVMCDEMCGYTLVVIVGNRDVPCDVRSRIEEVGAKHDVKINFKSRLSDYEKFREICSSVLMLFPSFFEGFGYPPVEAQYCNVPCIAFDLPVLREVSGEGIVYVKPGDWKEFRDKIKLILKEKLKFGNLRENVKSFATVESYSERLQLILEKVMKAKAVRVRPMSGLVFLDSVVGKFFSKRGLGDFVRKFVRKVISGFGIV